MSSRNARERARKITSFQKQKAKAKAQTHAEAPKKPAAEVAGISKLRPGYAVNYWEGSHGANMASARYTPEYIDLQFARRELLKGVGKKPHVIVDIGAGTGEITAGLEHPNIRIISLEPAKKAMIAAHKAPHDAVRSIAERLSLHDNSVDGALMAYTLEYTNRDMATDELNRVMKPGARAVLLMHKPGSEYMKSIKAEAMRNEDFARIMEKLKKGAYKDTSEIEQDFYGAGMHEHPEGKYVLPGLMKLWEQRKRKQVPKGEFVSQLNGRIERLRKGGEPIAMLARGENVFKTREEAEEYFKGRGFEVEKIEVLEHPGAGTTGYGAVLRKPKAE